MRYTDMADELFGPGQEAGDRTGIRLATLRQNGMRLTRVEISRDGLARPRGQVPGRARGRSGLSPPFPLSAGGRSGGGGNSNSNVPGRSCRAETGAAEGAGRGAARARAGRRRRARRLRAALGGARAPPCGGADGGGLLPRGAAAEAAGPGRGAAP